MVSNDCFARMAENTFFVNGHFNSICNTWWEHSYTFYHESHHRSVIKLSLTLMATSVDYWPIYPLFKSPPLKRKSMPPPPPPLIKICTWETGGFFPGLPLPSSFVESDSRLYGNDDKSVRLSRKIVADWAKHARKCSRNLLLMEFWKIL